MRVFEFYFNPKTDENVVFDSFCYEAEKPYEKKLGNLYIAGSLKNVLPQNARLLQKLAQSVRGKYYGSKSKSPETALKSSLKEANKFLDKISKEGDVSWLGNLDFIIISIKDNQLRFAKTGDIKPLLARAGQITDIERNIELEEIEPYPIKIFTNIVSGKLAEADLLLILTKGLFENFDREDVLKSIAGLEAFEDKSLKEILDAKKEILENASGLLLAVHFINESALPKKQTISPEKIEKFSFKKAFSPVLEIFKKLPELSVKKGRKSSKKALKFRIPEIKVSLPKLNLKKGFIKKSEFKKIMPAKSGKKPKLSAGRNLILISGLAAILVLGFAYASFEKNRKNDQYFTEVQAIQKNIEMAESFILLKDTNPEAISQANLLLEQSWEKILVLGKNSSGLPKDFINQISDLKNEISDKLALLNKTEIIENPELFFESSAKEFVSHKILMHGETLYAFNPYNKNILRISQNKEAQIIESEKSFDAGTNIDEAALFFSKPSQITIVNDGNIDAIGLESPSFDFNFNELASFKGNLYFFRNKTGEIVKYPYLENLTWGSPALWLDPQSQKITDADSFALDNSAWILKDNRIYNYYKGEFRKELEPVIFPKPKDFSKIYTLPSSDYLYLMEPVQKRIVILDKNGNIAKQFQSEQFDNLLDLAVSEDEKTIYLLNGLKIYEIDLRR